MTSPASCRISCCGQQPDDSVAQPGRHPHPASQGRVEGEQGGRPTYRVGPHAEGARELSACPLALLELSASEAAVERSFSRHGLVHSKQRNRFSDGTVHLSMSFALNSSAPKKANAPPSEQGCEVLQDDYPPVDVVRGTDLLSHEDIAAAEESEEEGSSQPTHPEQSEAPTDSEAEEERRRRWEEEKDEEDTRVQQEREEGKGDGEQRTCALV